jgi:hypothetical protein
MSHKAQSTLAQVLPTRLSHRSYSGKRGHGAGVVPGPVLVTDNGTTRPLSPRLDIVNHSPTGLNWGYCGSGPQQLAIALLADAVDDDTAVRLAGRFKFDVIGGLPNTWTLTREDILAWVRRQ